MPRTNKSKRLVGRLRTSIQLLQCYMQCDLTIGARLGRMPLADISYSGKRDLSLYERSAMKDVSELVARGVAGLDNFTCLSSTTPRQAGAAGALHRPRAVGGMTRLRTSEIP